MSVLSIIVPTISGREKSLARTLAAYQAHTKVPYEFVTVKDLPNWPSGCNEGYRQARGDTLHFGADDLVPMEGWADEVLPWLETNDELPAAKVLNHSAKGRFDNQEDGQDRQIVWFTRVPVMRRDQYERIGPWPEIDYYADVWLSEKARILGVETRMFYSYSFIHYWSKIGRLDSQENLARAWGQYQTLGR